MSTKVKSGEAETRGRIGWLDPSLHSANRGDDIIADAVRRVWAVLGEPEPPRFPTQRRPSPDELSDALRCDHLVIGGTNILSSNMPWYRQWKLLPQDVHALRSRVLLLGVGWWQYQGKPNAYTRWVLRTALRKTGPHSVRDEYTARRLRALGLPTRNTGCPTTWWLPDEPESRAERADEVVFSLTDYKRDPESDLWLFDMLRQRYDNVLFWPQSQRDVRYAQRLRIDAEILAGTLPAFDAALAHGRRDFVGTRLHGGIRALSHGCRATIVAVDNRATEMGADMGLPVASRYNRSAVLELIDAERHLVLRIPRSESNAWLDDMTEALAAQTDGS